tara:strand:+ start:597 stop:902 length:306 start_codon:yes stop_codon:yes gene_type:complete
MKISKLAAKPQLIQIKLENKELVKKYGEVIEFHTWDRQPLATFMELANANSADSKPGDIIHLVKDLILDEDGKPVMSDDNTLPTDVLLIAVGAIVDRLGKL